MPTSAARLRELRAAIHSAPEALDLPQLAAQPLEHLRRALGASGALFYRFRPDGSPEGLGGPLLAALPSYVAELFAFDPVQQTLLRRPLCKPVIDPHETGIDFRAFRKSAAYHHFYRPSEVEHLLGFPLSGATYGAAGMTGVLFTRSRREEDFSGEETRLLARAAPSWRAAVRRDERLQSLRRANQSLQAAVGAVLPEQSLVVDGRGRLLWISPAARERLSPEKLDQLVRAIESWRAAPSASDFIECGGVSARLTRADAAGIVIAQLAVEEPRHLALLTNAERRILASLEEGLSNRAAATRHQISIETVRTHVARILDKLGVETRLQAVLEWQRWHRRR